MVTYQVHRSADYLEYRISKLKENQNKECVLLKRFPKLGGKT